MHVIYQYCIVGTEWGDGRSGLTGAWDAWESRCEADERGSPGLGI